MKYFVTLMGSRLHVQCHDQDFLSGKDLCRAIEQKIYSVSGVKLRVSEGMLAIVVQALSDAESRPELPETQSEWITNFAEFFLGLLEQMACENQPEEFLDFAYSAAEQLAEVAEVPIGKITENFSFIFAEKIGDFPKGMLEALGVTPSHTSNAVMVVIPIEALPINDEAAAEISDKAKLPGAISIGKMSRHEDGEKGEVTVGVYSRGNRG